VDDGSGSQQRHSGRLPKPSADLPREGRMGPAIQRLAALITAARARFGDDPLFEALLAEAALGGLISGSACSVPQSQTAAWKGLTARERQVACLLSAGMTDRQIATALGIRVATARGHTRAVLTELGLRSRRDLR
jgi:DNA-binding CsgD family transcriptional regulator